MAAVLARVFSRACKHKSTSSLVFSKCQRLHGFWRISGTNLRSLSGSTQYSPGTRHQTASEDEVMYEVNEDNIEVLRKQHREQAKRDHISTEQVTFSDFPINTDLLNQLKQLGYNEPFEIQSKTLLPTLSGRDVIGKAVTGSGKTLAFCIPILQKLSQSSLAPSHRRTKSPRAIVISPTRELCLQLHRTLEELSSNLRCIALYGGASFFRQEKQMRNGVDVICATPGRLNDHLQRGTINLEKVCFLCLDEADELLTPNFKDQIEGILQGSPEDKQMMLFSATMPANIRSIVNNYMNNPVHVDITSGERLKTPESVRHLCMKVASSQHVPVIKHLLNEYKPDRCIVFMETKLKTREVAQVLRHKMGLSAEGLHSDLSQSRRENIMAAFREGQIKILVATDVAARGLDVPEVSLIIQAGPPKNGSEYYVHRAGRTGRGGREGYAILLHSGSRTDMDIINEIEHAVKLEHVGLPNAAELQAESVRHLVTNLQGMSAKRCNSIASVLEEMQLTSEQCRHVLCAAVVSLLTTEPLTDSAVKMHFSGRHSSSAHVHQTNRRKKYRYDMQGDKGDHYPRERRYDMQGEKGDHYPRRKSIGYYSRHSYGRKQNEFSDEYESDDDDVDIHVLHNRFKTSRKLN